MYLKKRRRMYDLNIYSEKYFDTIKAIEKRFFEKFQLMKWRKKLLWNYWMIELMGIVEKLGTKKDGGRQKNESRERYRKMLNSNGVDS